MSSAIRSFIREETKEPIQRVNEFIQVRHHPLLLPMLDPGARPRAGCRAHVLAAEMRLGTCLAHIQMFLTEHNPGRIYTVNLAQDPAIPEPSAHAHLYQYFQAGSREDFLARRHRYPRFEWRWPFHRQAQP